MGYDPMHQVNSPWWDLLPRLKLFLSAAFVVDVKILKYLVADNFYFIIISRRFLNFSKEIF